ncbi:MAG: hypothetical protein AAF890_09275 [Pseudomonadota bacterium]
MSAEPTPFVKELRERIAGRSPSSEGTGRGLVTAFGGNRNFTNGYVLLRLLREELGCTLPIEVWHFGEGELTPVMRHLLAPLDVTLVDARAVQDTYPADVNDGWQLKAYAMMHCAFSEVLFLDADQVPVMDPAALFDWPEYLEKGAVFWPDIVDFRAQNGIWDLLGLEPRTGASFETGQILVDKRRHAKTLDLTLALNERSDVIYDHMYGDKDTFFMAWQLDAADYAFVPHRPMLPERTLLQRGFDGEVLFQHRTNSKWLYSGSQHTYEGEVHRDVCHGYLADLKMIWNGQLFCPPDRSVRAIEAERVLVERGAVLAQFEGDRKERWEFVYPNEFGEGRGLNRRNWFIVEDDGVLRLVFVANGQVSYQFSQIDGGGWQGQSIEAVGETVTLMAEETMMGRPPLSGFQAVSPLLDGVIEASGFVQSRDEISRKQLTDTMSLLLRAQPQLREALESYETGKTPIAPVARDVLERVPKAGSRAPNKRSDALEVGYVDWRAKRI